MGLSITLYQIDQITFEKAAANPAHFDEDGAIGYEHFEKNFDGIRFLIGKYHPNEDQNLINEIFYPKSYLGEKIDDIDYSTVEDFSFLDKPRIEYLPIEKVKSINTLLKKTNIEKLLTLYDYNELNGNGIYPGIWHDDESPNKAFNKRHIAEGLKELQACFEVATENNYYIFSFAG